jgi:hypothetical protein
MIELTCDGEFTLTEKYLKSLQNNDISSDLDHYGRLGLDALASATPVDSGLAASSWGYRILNEANGPTIEWYNTDIEGGVSVVILIQYGHGTGTGGYVAGRDFINPAIQGVFDKIAEDLWKKVSA